MKILLTVLLTISFSSLLLADSETLIHENDVIFTVNANTRMKCRPGTEAPMFETYTVLSVDSVGGVGFGVFKNNVDRVTLSAGFGDQCAQFDQFFGNPNPHWVKLIGKRRVLKYYQTQFGSKCAEFLREDMTVKIEGTELELTGRNYFDIGFVDLKFCQ
ncbi:hypothetical protein N9O57_02335 [bacterium]|nr:hypothetical protein [bacterium]